MIGKKYVLECDWCGDIRLGMSLKGMSKHYFVYRFKSVNKLANEIWLHNKPNQYASKYIAFCCKECADKYFEENIKDKPFYQLIS